MRLLVEIGRLFIISPAGPLAFTAFAQKNAETGQVVVEGFLEYASTRVDNNVEASGKGRLLKSECFPDPSLDKIPGHGFAYFPGNRQSESALITLVLHIVKYERRRDQFPTFSEHMPEFFRFCEAITTGKRVSLQVSFFRQLVLP